MPWLEPVPVNSGTSKGFEITSDIRIPNPFDPDNLTWNEISASTANDWCGFTVVTRTPGGSGMFFVGIGEAGSETIVSCTPVSIGWGDYLSFQVPIAIPSGTRVAIAASCSSTETVTGQIVGVVADPSDELPPYTVMECGPFDLTTSFGQYGQLVEVDPGGTANTKGSWTEVSKPFADNPLNGDSLDSDYDWLGFLMSDTRQFQTSQDRLWDIATGAASSEVIQVADLYQHYDGNERGLLEATPMWFPSDVASGTRISARMQASITDANDRVGTIILFGLR